MKRSRFTEDQIFAILKEADAGESVKEVCRRHGISSGTYYQWKSKYGGLQPSDLKRLKELMGLTESETMADVGGQRAEQATITRSRQLR